MAEEPMEKSGSGYFCGLLTGLFFGVAAALLLAPKRGDEIRHDLAEGASRLKVKAGDLSGTVAETAHELKERGQGLVENLRARGETMADTALDAAHDLKEQASDAMDEAKDVAQTAKEDVKDQSHDVVESI